jgi:CBS domain-containing protein
MVANFIQRKIPYCRLHEAVGPVLERFGRAGPLICPVLNEEEIVLGLVTEKARGVDPATPVEEAMDPAPVTIRPSAPAEEALRYMERSALPAILVTSSDGRLLGLFARDEKVRRFHG